MVFLFNFFTVFDSVNQCLIIMLLNISLCALWPKKSAKSAVKNNSFLPKRSCCRDVAAWLKCDCIFGADGAADSAAVTSFGVYHSLLICCAISYGAELADAHALPAAVALVRIDSGDVFGPVHNGDSLGDRAAHG